MKKLFLLLLPFIVLSQVNNSSFLNKDFDVFKGYELDKLNRIQNYYSLQKNSLSFNNFDDFRFNVYDIIDGKPVYISNSNRSSGFAVNVHKLYPSGSLNLNLTGLGMKVGVWDGGWVFANHQEFMVDGVSKVSTPDNPFPSPNQGDSHATHVAGTVAAKGVNTNARGMAYDAQLISYNWTDDLTEVTTEASQNGLLISNHSYGIPVLNNDGTQNAPTWLMGCYNTTASLWDQLAFSNPYYLTVASAGNSGQDNYNGGLAPGFDKLTGNKNSKNSLIIANANPTVNVITGAITSVFMNPSSSQGPTDDGRIKPDIAADGTNVFSTGTSSSTAYTTLTGTSMAAPSVAGTLLLLQQHHFNLKNSYMLSSTLRGLVCHTATEIGFDVGPNPISGWGLLNAEKSAQLLSKSVQTNPTAILEERSMANNQTYSFNVVVSEPSTLIASISWTDPAGAPQNNVLNSTIPALVNNLDLRVFKDGVEYLPWKFDLTNLNAPIKGDNNVDNFEKIQIDNALGTYTIQVSHKGQLTNAQVYSLIVDGFNQSLSTNVFNPDSDLVLYPNPAVNSVNIKTSLNIMSYEIYDLNGRKVLSSSQLNSQSNFSIDVSVLDKGFYQVFLSDGVNVYSKKLIKN